MIDMSEEKVKVDIILPLNVTNFATIYVFQLVLGRTAKWI